MDSKIAKRLFESWTHRRGCSLQWREVEELLADDAVATRICNVAAEDAGVAAPGEDRLRPRMLKECWTWSDLKRSLRYGKELFSREDFLEEVD